MMQKDAPPKPFSIIYYSVVSLLVLILLLGVLRAPTDENPGDMIILAVFLFGVFFGTPLVTVLFLLTIWRVIWYRSRRIVFAALMIPMVYWSIAGIDAMINMPLP